MEIKNCSIYPRYEESLPKMFRIPEFALFMYHRHGKSNRVKCLPHSNGQALRAPTSSTHRLRRGLPGYLILFAPHAFAPQRQCRSRWLPSPSVFFPISTNFTSTLGIPPSSPELERASLKRGSQVEPGAFTPDLTHRLRALYAQ